MKICSLCKTAKRNTAFNESCKRCISCNDARRLAKLQYKEKYPEKVREQKRIESQRYHAKHKDQINQQKQEYRKHNSDKVKQQRKKSDKLYYEKNKVAINAKKRSTIKRVKHIDNLNSKLKKALRKRLYKSIKYKTKTISYIGCSGLFLREHLEKQFYPHPETGALMTWENWGQGERKWQVDHVKQFSQIDINNHEQLLGVIHFSNLQPLWTIDHVKKTALVAL